MSFMSDTELLRNADPKQLQINANKIQNNFENTNETLQQLEINIDNSSWDCNTALLARDMIFSIEKLYKQLKSLIDALNKVIEKLKKCEEKVKKINENEKKIQELINLIATYETYLYEEVICTDADGNKSTQLFERPEIRTAIYQCELDIETLKTENTTLESEIKDLKGQISSLCAG